MSALSQLANGLFAPRQATQGPLEPQAPQGILARIAGGINKFGDELLMPTSGIGKLGAYLGAAGGGQLGLASMAAMRDARGSADSDIDRQIKEMQLQRLQNPLPPNNDTINDYNFIRDRRGQAAADSYLDTIVEGPPIAYDYLNQVTGNTERGWTTRGKIGGSQVPRTAPAGVTFTPIEQGGQTPPVSGGFR